MSEHANDPAIAWVTQNAPTSRTVLGYAAARVPATSSPEMLVAAANRVADAAMDRPLGELPARLLRTSFVTAPLSNVPVEVFDDGYGRGGDVAVVAIVHMPEGAAATAAVSERQERMFPPLGWEARSE